MSIHFHGGEENIELILRTVISTNQLSIYGAVADLSRASGKTDAYEYLETVDIPTEPLIADRHIDAEPQGNLLQDCFQNCALTLV